MKFFKMHSCGNDFCIVENSDIDFSNLAVNICNRNIGVGADGLIVVKKKPLEMICYDSNGEIVSLSANGIRCFVKYVIDSKIVSSKYFDVITKNGIINVEIESFDPLISKTILGKPNFSNRMIYIKDNISSFGRTINVNDYKVTIYSFYLGDIETVIFIDSMDSHLIDLAESISNHELFARKTNVNFVHVINNNTIEVKSYIRGIGFVNASGTGVASCLVAGYKLGLTKNKALVKLKYGEVLVEFNKKEIVTMSGSAHLIIEGDYKED